MFDKKLLMNHIKNETSSNKMMKAGVQAPFYENKEQIDEIAPLVMGAARAVGALAKGGAAVARGAGALGGRVARATFGSAPKVKSAAGKFARQSGKAALATAGEVVGTQIAKKQQRQEQEEVNEVSHDMMSNAYIKAKTALALDDKMSPERRKKLQRQAEKFRDQSDKMFRKYGELGGSHSDEALDALKGRYETNEDCGCEVDENTLNDPVQQTNVPTNVQTRIGSNQPVMYDTKKGGTKADQRRKIKKAKQGTNIGLLVKLEQTDHDEADGKPREGLLSKLVANLDRKLLAKELRKERGIEDKYGDPKTRPGAEETKKRAAENLMKRFSRTDGPDY